MADNKRNSINAKVATPKVNVGPSPAESLETLSKVIGGRYGDFSNIGPTWTHIAYRIKVTTSASQTFEGTIFTVCGKSDLSSLGKRLALLISGYFGITVGFFTRRAAEWHLE